MRTKNPALNDKTFRSYRSDVFENPMTLGGTINKTFILFALVLVSAVWTWNLYSTEGAGAIGGWLILGFIVGLITALITIFKVKAAPFTAPIYALAEGLILGGLSAMFEAQWQGITIQAVSLTLGIMIVMLFLYKTRVIKVTEKFRMGVVSATLGIAAVYFIDIILNFFGVNVPFIHSSGLIGIGISILIVIVAALNLILDFDVIEQGVKGGAPKYMEWFGAFALMVTLIWLYLEALRLISKLRN